MVTTYPVDGQKDPDGGRPVRGICNSASRRNAISPYREHSRGGLCVDIRVVLKAHSCCTKSNNQQKAKLEHLNTRLNCDLRQAYKLLYMSRNLNS